MLYKNVKISVLSTLEHLGIDHNTAINANVVTHCPWPENHSRGDRNPSFSVNIETGMWICFGGCGAGPLTALVQRLNNLNPVEAGKWMISHGGLHLTMDDLKSAMPQKKIPVSVENAENPIARADYNMMRDDITSTYFLDRGFTWDTIDEWGIRYDRDLRAVVLPVFDITGNHIVSMCRRMVPPVSAGLPKYKYTSGADISKHLFGAYKHPRDGRRTIVVEGPLDALWLHQNGYVNAVGLMGSNCSKAQASLLLKLSDKVTLVLDNDEVGRKATETMIKNYGKLFTISVASCYNGAKDVQELDGVELDELIDDAKYLWR